MTGISLILASALCASLYGARLTGRAPSLGRSVVKTLPVSLLAVLVAMQGGPILLALALACGAFGDWCLSRSGQGWFLAGLSAFLLGHLAYLVLLVPLVQGAPWMPPRLWAVLGLVALAVLVLRQLIPHLGALKGPVLVYTGIICAMGGAAVGLPPAGAYLAIILGALAFIASDAILGFELFVFPTQNRPRAWPGPALWTLYYSGQVGLSFGILHISGAGLF